MLFNSHSQTKTSRNVGGRDMLSIRGGNAFRVDHFAQFDGIADRETIPVVVEINVGFDSTAAEAGDCLTALPNLVSSENTSRLESGVHSFIWSTIAMKHRAPRLWVHYPSRFEHMELRQHFEPPLALESAVW